MKKVIICDDSRVSALALQNLMTKENILIEATVFNQKDFIKALDNHEKPDFVSMDMILPDGSGVECCQLLWEKYPSLPVIFITGDEVTASDKEKLPHVKAYLKKPVTPEIVKESISKL